MLQYLLENLTILKEESIRRSEKQSSVYESVQSICASQQKTGLHAQQFWTNWKTIQNTAHSESHWVFSLDMYCLLLDRGPPVQRRSIQSPDRPLGSILLESALVDGHLYLMRRNTVKPLSPISRVD